MRTVIDNKKITMNIRINSLLLLAILVGSCLGTSIIDKSKSSLDELRIKNLIEFFNTNSYQSDIKTFYSEIDNSGQIVSKKIYNVALSRLIYGLSYASKFDNSYLNKAKNSVAFQLDKLTANDSIGNYFISYYDIETNEFPKTTEVDIWQQAYGLCGLSELYRNDPSDKLLSVIHKFHDDFVSRFHDEINGGLYGNYNLKNGQVAGSKSLQALVYPITAYMENLWLADIPNRSKYEPYLIENLEIAYKNGWDDDLGWVNLKFDDEWTPCINKSKESLCSSVSPGHNFQFASLLLRTDKWTFLTPDTQNNYHDLGIKILKRTLKKPIYAAADLSQGFYSEINPVTDEVTDYKKTWWQHCEALIALSLAEGQFKNELTELSLFYFENFSDVKNGGEYFSLDKNNEPQVEELKGSIGKSAYHTIEMIRYLRSQ